MARKLTVVVSQGQSANPIKRKLEEDLVGALLFEPGVEVTVIPNLYDLSPDGTGMLCLHGITGDMVVLSWLFPRAAHWTLNRNGIQGRVGTTLLVDDAEDADEDSDEEEADDDGATPPPTGEIPNRQIYCLDLRVRPEPGPFVEEIRRIQREASIQTVSLMGPTGGLMSWINGSPKPEQLERYLAPAQQSDPAREGDTPPYAPPVNGAAIGLSIISAQHLAAPATNGHAAPDAIEAEPNQPIRVEEETVRRWYPVIDFARCTNCLECLDFCLFGVYGVDQAEHILVEQPDNCRKGCPACSRVCPANAIIFPQHKTPTIAGSATGAAGGLKIDLSKLFGAPDAMHQAALERDVELVAVGRDAVGMSVGIPKRQPAKASGPKDDLDKLMDQLDDLSL